MKNLLIIVFLFLVLVAISSTDARQSNNIEMQLIGIANDILDVRELLMKIETHEGLIFKYAEMQTDLLIQIRDNTAK